MKPLLPLAPLLLPVNRLMPLSLRMSRPLRVLEILPLHERSLGSTLSGGARGSPGVELVAPVEVKMRSLLLAVVPVLLGLPGVGAREGPVGLGKSSRGVRVGARRLESELEWSVGKFRQAEE
jgi:hypothetical protein